MARENSKLGSNPGRYSSGIRAKVAAVWMPSCDCFKCVWFWEIKLPKGFRFCFDLKGQNVFNLVK